jgi:hypothetical protein
MSNTKQTTLSKGEGGKGNDRLKGERGGKEGLADFGKPLTKWGALDA